MNRFLLVAVVVGLAGCTPEEVERTELTPGATAAAAQTAVVAEPGSAGVAASSQAARRVVYVDVRTPAEFATGHVEGAIHIPHTEMAARLGELEGYRDAELVLYCRTGNRSGIAEEILRNAGFQHLVNGGALTDLVRKGVPTTR
jgi:phage shock protein E